MKSLTIGTLFSGGIITNYSCTSSCKHCLYYCSPRREKDFIEIDQLQKVLKTLKKFNCHSIHIGGGEPFLNFEKLISALEIIKEAGITVDYIESNCSWHRNEVSTVQILNRIRKAGVSTLLISISPFHNEFIPFERTLKVMQACSEVGIGIFPWKDFFISELDYFSSDHRHTLSEFEEMFGAGYLANLPKRYWIHHGGRSLNTFRPVLNNYSIKEIQEQNPGDCRERLSDTSHFHVDLFGNFIPGLCTGLAIDHRDLGEPVSEEKYPILSMLAKEGINGLLEFASQHFGYIPIQKSYLNKCDLCTEIRVFLRSLKINFSELEPTGFYIEATRDFNTV